VSWIQTVAPGAAGGPLDPVYARIAAASSRGAVAAAWQAQSLAPAALGATHDLYRALMADPAPLSRAQAELIAVVVSAVNGAGYCVAHHGPRLAGALGDEALARAVALDYRSANLAARDRVLLDHCVALTCEPSERTRQDLERLHEYGFDDAAILQATSIAAFYNLVNRLVTVLGVALEADVAPWEFGSQK